MCSVHRRVSGPEKKRCISKFFNLFVTFLLSFSTPDFESVHLIKLIKELGNPSLQKVTKLALNKNSTLVKKKNAFLNISILCPYYLLWCRSLNVKYNKSAIISRGLYFFIPNFHFGCGLYCRQFMYSKWKFFIFKIKIRSL